MRLGWCLDPFDVRHVCSLPCVDKVEIAGVLHRLHAVRLEEMAILTPYSAQRDEIRKLAVEDNLLEEIKAGESPKGIKVASITESQGKAPIGSSLRGQLMHQ